jgi:hyperosmotically inducible protein
MKNTIVTACIAVATLLAPIGAQAADSDSAKTVVKDSVITTKIKAKLAEEKMSTLMHLRTR